jgi:peroxiredoxin
MSKFITMIFALALTTAQAQPATSEVADFSATDVNNGNVVSLKQFTGEMGVVVIFRGNECPYDSYYDQRIAELVRAYKQRIPIILVNPYLEPQESEDKMKMYATVWALGIPYLADKDQKIMNALGARKTPEAFVLRNSGGKFTVSYSGAIDDNPQLPAGVKQKHLQTAIDMLIAGQQGGATVTVRTTGCTIRKK